MNSSMVAQDVISKFVDHGFGHLALNYATTILAALGAWLWCYRWFQRNTTGPKAWPLVGALPEIQRNWGNLHEYLTGFFSESTRTIILPLGGSTGVLTADPESVEYILQTNFSNYPKGPINAAINEEMFGHGIFNVDGDEWKQQRRVAASEFASAKLRDFSTNVFKEYAVRLAFTLEDFHRSQPPRSFDLQDLFMRTTLDTTCRVGFGVDLGCLSPGLPKLPFSVSFENTNAASFRRFVDPLWRLKRILQVGREQILKESLKVMDEFTYNVIKTRKAETSPSTQLTGNQKKDEQDLLSRFMKLSIEGKNKFNDRALRDIILNFIVAGRDTSAVAMSWFFYMLCCHPEVTVKIREELNSLERQQITPEEGVHQPRDKEMQAFAELLTYENLGTLNYLHAALTETMRLYPPVPLDGKFAVADDLLPDGTKVRRGNIVAFYAYAMGRMEHLWGPDALEFKPDRWLRDGVFQPASLFKFTAFQAGPRLCLGKDSAYVQMKLTAALLVRFFDVHLTPGHRVHYRTMLLLTMVDGLKVTVTPFSENLQSVRQSHTCTSNKMTA